MKFFLYLLLFACTSCAQASKTVIFVGSTPAHDVVRDFFGISKTDSIDFIRWKVTMNKDNYELSCQYGISKGGTPGFINEKSIQHTGTVSKRNHIYTLHQSKQALHLLQVNGNLLHLLNNDEQMLVGNGGYSYVLNNANPVVTDDDFNISPTQNRQSYPIVFEGRTPCQELSTILKLNKGLNCNKLKWYFLLYVDSLTGTPSYYLEGGMGYRKETMKRGKWQIDTLKNGRIIYQITPDTKAYTLNLLKGDDNILFFIRPDGTLLVGNENFSYTLNRRQKEYKPLVR